MKRYNVIVKRAEGDVRLMYPPLVSLAEARRMAAERRSKAPKVIVTIEPADT